MISFRAMLELAFSVGGSETLKSAPLGKLQGKEDLVCVINGFERRAVWLSWSMVLCR